MVEVLQKKQGNRVEINRARDENLTSFGKSTLYDRYLLPDEDPQDRFANVAAAYGDDSHHAQRLYDYISKLWFMPSTPVLSNGGTTRGLPISCFLNENLQGIGWKYYSDLLRTFFKTFSAVSTHVDM